MPFTTTVKPAAGFVKEAVRVLLNQTLKRFPPDRNSPFYCLSLDLIYKYRASYINFAKTWAYTPVKLRLSAHFQPNKNCHSMLKIDFPDQKRGSNEYFFSASFFSWRNCFWMPERGKLPSYYHVKFLLFVFAECIWFFQHRLKCSYLNWNLSRPCCSIIPFEKNCPVVITKSEN